MEKGVSPIISMILLVLVSISAVYLVLFVAKPTIDRAYESADMNEAEKNLELLDNLIREVASEGTGSHRSVVLKVSDGDYRTVNMSGNFTGALQYKIDLKYSPYTAPMLKKVGNVKYTAGMNGIGLTMYLNLDDGNGTTAADSSDYNNYGVIYNGTTSCANPSTSGAGCPEWVDGNFRKALKFDGVNDFANVSHSVSLQPSSSGTISVSVWINSSFSGQNSTIVIKNYDDTQLSYDLELYEGKCCFSVNATQSAACWDTLLAANEWAHLVGVYNGTHNLIYVNGALKNSSSYVNGIKSSSSPLLIGRKNIWGNYFNGTIDEVRIYKKALTADEIKENYNTKPSNYQVFLEYSKIIITGNVKIGGGEHKLCIEKIGELNNKPLVRITAC